MDAYVQLVQARIDAAGDSAAYAAKRDRVLLDARLEPADLRAYVASGRRDPLALREAWQTIAARLDTLYGGVTSRPPPGLRDALRTPGDSTSTSPRAISPGTSERASRPSVPRPGDSSAARRDAPGAAARTPGADSSRARPPDVEKQPEPRPPPIPGDTLERAAPTPGDALARPAPTPGDSLERAAALPGDTLERTAPILPDTARSPSGAAAGDSLP